ncbi:MAG TPA: hypothetical protein VJT84_10200, partial [Gaiellaceae bacterium]|nr:hypothetical protein [Gaiellaceae bacterium]
MFRHRLAPRMRLRFAFVVVVAIAIWAVAAAPTPAAVHTFGTVTPGGSYGCPAQNRKYGNKYTLTETGSVTKITAYMKGNGGTPGTQIFRTMIYAADGAGGAPGTLLATSATATVDSAAAPGEVDFPISPAVSLPAGDYWIAQQSGGTSAKACLAGDAVGTNDFNTDTFSDGPSATWGAVNQDSNTWTLYATYDTAAPTDTTAPTITGSRTPNANANGWNNSDVTVSFDCQDEAGGSGVASVSGPTTVSTEGADQSVTGTCTDNAGNSAEATVSGISIDKTNPSASATPSPGANGNGWNNTDVTVTFGCTDSGGSGVDTVTSLATLSAEGANQSATGTCSDKAGNSDSATASGINIDKTNPQISAGTPSPAANGNGWNNTDVSVTFDCSDPGGSGVEAATDVQTVSTEGAGQSATGTCTDLAGNTASATKNGINIDKTKPSVSASPSPAPNANGWNNTDVTVTYDCTDGGSGVDSAPAADTLSAEGANQSATGTCTDKAGNSASATASGINIDKTKPSITPGSPSPAPNGNGWNNTNVSVTFGCSDVGGSGVVSASDVQTVSSEGSNLSATGTCTDKAGNSNSASVGGINIDKTNPSITAGSPSPGPNGNGWNNTNVSVTFGCSDVGGSGVVSATDVKTVSSEGTNQSATGTCTDKAGNSNSASVGGINI